MNKQKKYYTDFENKSLAEIIIRGGVGIMPADTMYGISCSIDNKSAVERVYKLKNRSMDKPFIILVSSFLQLKKMGFVLTSAQLKTLHKYWPGKITFILPYNSEQYNYLHYKNNSLAVRMPANDQLLDLLNNTGPLISTSVNKAGQYPAETCEQAITKLGDEFDFMVDVGKKEVNHSTLVDLTSQQPNVLRQGEVNFFTDEE